MSAAKPVQLGLSPEFLNFFEAINLHMQVNKQPHLITSSSATHQLDTSIPADDAQEEARLVLEIMEQFRLIEQALLNFGEHADPKKIELGNDVQNSFNELWSQNLTVVIKAIEFLRSILKDMHRYWPYLEGQMDRLVMACARVIGLMFTRYKSSLFVNSHAATRVPIINLLNSTAQLFHSIIRKSPLLPSKISPETYSVLFESLIPYFPMSTRNSANLDLLVQSKIQSIITDMLSMSELNNLLFALLRTINENLIKYNQDTSLHSDKMNILIKWIEQLCSYLSDSKVSNLNLDLILNEADVLIRAYPNTVFEYSRDYRLLEAIREIVFKIAEYKGDPGIWDHLAMIDLDKGDSGLIKYINIALERNELFKVLNSKRILPKHIDNRTKYVPIEQLVQKYEPILPDGLKLPNQEDKEGMDPELLMFHHWLNNLANTSDGLQAKLSLDYLNQNFDDLVSKFVQGFEPYMDFLVRACTRQYHLFTILYYPPNVGQPSSQSHQIFHATTSLLKRIFTSTISLKSVSSETVSEVLLHIFSLLSWSGDFSLEVLTQLESSILTNESLNKSDLICICIRVLRYAQMYTCELSCSIFDDIQRFARQMLTELILPLQFVTSEMMSQEYDLNQILYEINEYLLTIDAQTLQEDFDRFLTKENMSERTEDSRPLWVIEKLIYDIIQQRGYSIYDNLKSTSNVCGQMQRFINELIPLNAKLNYIAVGSKYSTYQHEAEVEKRHNFLRSQVPKGLIKLLDKIDEEILPDFRKTNSYAFNLANLNQKLSTMIANYDKFSQYQVLQFSVIDSLTEICICAMVALANHSKAALALKPAELRQMYINIGELLLKMYGKPESLGHQYVTMVRLKELVQVNIEMVSKHSQRPKKQLEKHLHWIWSVQYALTNHSKPYFVLSFALNEFNSLLSNEFPSNYVHRSEHTNDLLIHLYTSMLEISCGQLFLYPTAIYSPSMSNDKFEVFLFTKQADNLFKNYPISSLEGERDYKVLVLVKRVLHRLYEHHGFLIQEFWGNSSQAERSQSPVYSFFEQLIEQNAQIEHKKFRESELKNVN